MKIVEKLAKVKSELTAVKKNVVNGFFKSKFADLNAHLELVEPLLGKQGLVLLQPVVLVDNKNAVKTLVLDAESGESVESTMLLIGDTDMQKLGSAVTYARRYTLGALLAIQAEDDDAEQSVGRAAAPAPKAVKPFKNNMDF